MTNDDLHLTPTDDAELTAYALGELDADAAAAVEQRLATDEAARRHVEELRETAALLRTELAAEVSPGLATEQREAIEARLRGAGAATTTSERTRLWIATAVSLAAASMLTALVLESATARAPETAGAGDFVVLEFDETQPMPEPAITTASWDGDEWTERPRSPRPSYGGGGGGGSGPADTGWFGESGSSPENQQRGGADRAGNRDGAGAREKRSGSSHGGAYRGPAGHVPPDSRDPMDPPPPPPEVGGPSTPSGTHGGSGGAGQTGTFYRMGGAGGGGGALARADRRREVGRRAAGPTTGGGAPAVQPNSKPMLPPEPVDALRAQDLSEAQVGGGGGGALPELESTLGKLLQEQSDSFRTVAGARLRLQELAKADTTVGYLGRNVALRRQLAEVRVIDGAAGPVVVLPGGQGRFARIDGSWVHQSRENRNGEAYAPIVENPFKGVLDEPVSTFSVDVDTASYANTRRMLNAGQLPPADAVRIEEFVNYFDYDYAPPAGGEAPFASHVEVTSCPWNLDNRLVRVGLKGREFAHLEPKLSNLVFLVDVSGSMNSHDKLPLLQQSLRLLVGELGENDRVAIVVYAGASGMVLDSTSATDQATILAAIDNLRAGGSTNGGAGIELAYKVAQENFISNGVNRVVLATDGDFNVGTTDRQALVELIEEKAQSKVFLSVLGFGTGNLKDATMEQLADKGNGNYSYIDSIREGRKVLVEERGGTLVTIAKDVKLQIEFNPAEVQSYRLVGYENRMLAREDFNDDTKDAGEIGAGHTVTALYELVPANTTTSGTPATDPLKYQREFRPTDAAGSGELLTLKLRYKEPEGDTSRLLEFPVTDRGLRYDEASVDTKFAAAVASFGMLLRGSRHSGSATFDSVLELGMEGLGRDPGGYRAEFLDLVRKAKALR